MFPRCSSRFSLSLFLALAALAGCAQLIGAEFDGAKLGDGGEGNDASTTEEAGSDATATDGAAPTDAPIADAAFDARAIGDGGIALWLASDLAVEAGVEAGTDADALVGVWGDQSGNARDCVASAQKPALVRDEAGTPFVRFESARTTYFVSPKWSGPAGATGTTIFIVSKGRPDSLVRFQGPGVPEYLVFPWNRGTFVADGGPDYFLLVSNGFDAEKIRIPISVDRFAVATARIELGVISGMRTYKNGSVIEQTSLLGDAMPATDTLTIGCSYLGSECADADVAEIMVYGSALADEERATVEQYLMRKWQVAP